MFCDENKIDKIKIWNLIDLIEVLIYLPMKRNEFEYF